VEGRALNLPGMGKTLLRWLLVGAFIGIGIGAVIGLVLSRFVDLPAVESLMTYRPAAATRVLARDGTILGSFAAERRIPVGAEEIPKVFRDAVISVEDANFYRHTGVDPQGILRAALRNLFSGRWSQGASTITQQLPRSLGLLSREKKFTRKVKEMLFAIEIEQRLSKDQIFTLYANQVNFGHGNYGVEAASRFYFGKSAKDLTLPEAALLAGLPQRPGELSPIDFPKRALERRNHVLARMLEEKYITKAVYETARQVPLAVSAHYDRDVTAAYFVEEVRRSVEDRFGSKRMLEGGLEVQTTLDDKVQALAEDSLREGLIELQQRLGWPGARRNVLSSIPDLKDYHDESWPFIHWRKDELAYALTTEVQSGHASLLIAGPAGPTWSASRARATCCSCVSPRSPPTGPSRSRSCSCRSRRSRVRSSCSTTGPVRSSRSTEDSTSTARSSTGRCRPNASAGPRSNRSSTSPRGSTVSPLPT